jgi:hypothetical protein
MNFNPRNRYTPLSKINTNLKSNTLNSLKINAKKSSEDWETAQWQNIPVVVQEAIASLLENQNKLADQVEILEKKLTQQAEKVKEEHIERDERITEIVTKLGDEVQDIQEEMKSAKLDSEEGLNVKLRKFVLSSEMDRKIKEINERVDKTNKMMKNKMGNEEFQRVLERLETQDLELKRKLEEKADELELLSQKDDLEKLLMVQMQKLGKLISENAIKTLRNSKEIMKRVDEKTIHRLLSSKIEAVKIIRETLKG